MEMQSTSKLWSTKFILPEHREAMIQHSQNSKKKTRPTFDVQRFEELDFVTQDSIAEKLKIEVLVFGVFNDYAVRGIPTEIDPMAKRLKIQTEEDDYEWVPFRDILNIQRI